MSLISVIVPVYNVEQYICRCIDSILNQTFSDFDLILIDDGSPDNSGKICDEYAEKDNRITVIHQKNGGLSAARNAGLDYIFSKSNFDYITFIDSDDWVHPKYLEFLLKSLIDNNVKISSCLFHRVDSEVPLSDTSFACDVIPPEVLWKNDRTNAIVAVCKLYCRELFTSLRYPVGIIHEDEYTTFKAFFSCSEIAFVPLDLYYYYQNTDGIMLSGWNKKKAVIISAYKEQYDFFKTHGYSDFAEEALINYLYSYVKVIENLKEYYPTEKKLIKKTQKDYKKALNQHSEEINLKNRPDRNYFLRNAYPIKNKLMKKIKHFRQFIKKMFHG